MDQDIVANLPPSEMVATALSLSPRKIYMTNLTIDYSPVRDGAEQLALNSLAIHVFGRVSGNRSKLNLKRESPGRWKYDGSIALAAKPESGGLTLVAQSEYIGYIGHINFTRSDMEDLTIRALSNAKLEFVRQLVVEEGGPRVTLSFEVCITQLDENMVGDDHDPFRALAYTTEDPELLFLTSMIPDNDLEKSHFLKFCGSLLLERFLATKNEHNIDNSIVAFEGATQFSSAEDPQFKDILYHVGKALRERYNLKRHLSDLNRALEMFQILVGVTLDGDSNMPVWLNSVATSLARRFEQTGELSDVSKAISIHQKAILLTPEGKDTLPILLTNLRSSFVLRFQRTGDEGDISGALSAQQKAMHLIPESHTNMNICGSLFLRLFGVTGDEHDINSSITAFEKAAKLSSGGDLQFLHDTGNAFQKRYDLKRNPSDLNRAIEIFQTLVSSTADGDTSMPLWLNSLMGSLLGRFVQTGELGHISEAISIQQKAIHLTQPGHEDLPALLSNLGSLFVRRSAQTGDVSDMTDAISAHQRAIHLTPEGGENIPEMLDNLGNAYLGRFTLSGELSDISDAISAHRKCVHLTPNGHLHMPIRLDSLARSFGALYDRTGDLNDITEGIAAHQKAVDLTAEDHPSMPTLLSNLGSSFIRHFGKTKDLNDICKAISVQEKSVSLIPKGHLNRPGLLENLGTSLGKSFELTGNLNDISKAILALQQAIILTPEEHMNMHHTLSSNLAGSFLLRFKRTGDIDDISEAISAYEKAIRLTPKGHPNMPTVLYHLGHSLILLFQHTGDLSSILPAISNFRLAATSSTGSPAVCLRVAVYWAKLCQIVDPPQALDAYNTVIELLSQFVGMEQTIQKRHENLVKISHLPTSAAAAAFSIGHPEKALEWLEQGRCLVWNQLNNLRTPLDELHEYDSALADHLSRVSRALENAGSRVESNMVRTEGTMAQRISLQAETNAHIKLAQEWDQLLKKVRNIPRFKTFLRPPQCSNLLNDIPKEGAVIIINVHEDRCDALALTIGADTALHIPLDSFFNRAQEIQREMYHYLLIHGVRSRGSESECDEERKGRGLRPPSFCIPIRNVLREIWLLVVKPVLDALSISTDNPTPNLQRFWWCATGPLAFLPIHAAGLYDNELEKMGLCLIDFAISSYIPTVSTLVERVKKARTLDEAVHEDDDDGLLVVSVPETPRFPDLARIPGTTYETECIQEQLHGGNIRTLSLSGDSATINKVTEGMESHSCIHFACHATQELDNPLKSGFYLHDGQLELSEIIKKQIAISEFAFLSACTTSTGHATLSEEAVHLAAGMLAAGYQGVVGTMWAIQDQYGPQIAQDFYDHLINHAGRGGRKGLSNCGSAHALHYAIQQVRKIVGESEESLLIWVPYVHFGL